MFRVKAMGCTHGWSSARGNSSDVQFLKCRMTVIVFLQMTWHLESINWLCSATMHHPASFLNSHQQMAEHKLIKIKLYREMAIGNTFGATALSSYGGFWISYALILTPSLGVVDAYTTATDVPSVLGFFLTGWFIFTFILLICTLRSTVMFFLLFFTLDLAFLFLACAEYADNNGAANSAEGLQKAGGVFGILAAFLAWYNAFAGIADSR